MTGIRYAAENFQSTEVLSCFEREYDSCATLAELSFPIFTLGTFKINTNGSDERGWEEALKRTV